MKKRPPKSRPSTGRRPKRRPRRILTAKERAARREAKNQLMHGLTRAALTLLDTYAGTKTLEAYDAGAFPVPQQPAAIDSPEVIQLRKNDKGEYE